MPSTIVRDLIKYTYFVVSSKIRLSLDVNSGIFPSSTLKSSDSIIFLSFGTIRFNRAAEAPDLMTSSSSKALMTPSESSSTIALMHLEIFGLMSRMSITAPKSYRTNVPSLRTPMFPAWGSAWTRPMSRIIRT